MQFTSILLLRSLFWEWEKDREEYNNHKQLKNHSFIDTSTCRQLEHRTQHEQAVQMQGNRANQYTTSVPTNDREAWLENYRRGIISENVYKQCANCTTSIAVSSCSKKHHVPTFLSAAHATKCAFSSNAYRIAIKKNLNINEKELWESMVLITYLRYGTYKYARSSWWMRVSGSACT